MNMNVNDNRTPGCRSFGMSNDGISPDRAFISQLQGNEKVEFLDRLTLTATGVGHHHVPNDEAYATEVEPADVLCGRGKVSFNHVGNMRFRDLIAASVTSYIDAKSRLEKAAVVNAIVDEIHALGGRFLRRDEAAGTWHALGYSQCREKVGHAIRDAASCIESRKKRKQETAQKSAATAYVTKGCLLPAFSTGGTNDNSLAKLILGSDFVDDAMCDFNETDALKSSIDSNVKHFSEAKGFPEEEHTQAGVDPALFMEPVLDMESAQLGWESTMLVKGRQDDFESFEYMNGRGNDTSADGLVNRNCSAAMATKLAEDIGCSDEQDERDFLAYIDQVLGPLPGDGSTSVALQ